MIKMLKPSEFYKMSGAGNDFVVVDNRSGLYNAFDFGTLARSVCQRRFGVGADGMIFIENSKKANIKTRIFNSDGSEAEFCGNGLRCSARFALLRVIAGRSMTIEIMNQVVDAEVLLDGNVLLEFQIINKKPNLRELELQGRKIKGYFLKVGVPHFIIFVKEIEKAPVLSLGSTLRRHPDFGRDGTNVHFIELKDEPPFKYRTFERGVEGETLACGSGAVAIAILLKFTFNKFSPIKLMTRSNKILEVDIKKDKFQNLEISLKGEASFVYKGYFSDEFLQEAHK